MNKRLQHHWGVPTTEILSENKSGTYLYLLFHCIKPAYCLKWSAINRTRSLRLKNYFTYYKICNKLGQICFLYHFYMYILFAITVA